MKGVAEPHQSIDRMHAQFHVLNRYMRSCIEADSIQRQLQAAGGIVTDTTDARTLAGISELDPTSIESSPSLDPAAHGARVMLTAAV